MGEDFIPFFAIAAIFIGLPWLIFHYITKWKQSATLTLPDEKLLDDLYDAARRLDERMCSIERIIEAENPDWRQHCLPGTTGASERAAPRALLEELDELEERMSRLPKSSRSRGAVE